jgi:hypothetical protein
VWRFRFVQVRERAERATLLVLEMQVVGEVRRSTVTVELPVTVMVLPLLTVIVVVSNVVRFAVLP